MSSHTHFKRFLDTAGSFRGFMKYYQSHGFGKMNSYVRSESILERKTSW